MPVRVPDTLPAIEDLKQEINYKIANDDDFRLELCLDYLEYYENELKKYQK